MDEVVVLVVIIEGGGGVEGGGVGVVRAQRLILGLGLGQGLRLCLDRLVVGGI